MEVDIIIDAIIMIYILSSLFISFGLCVDLVDDLGNAFTPIIKFMRTKNWFGKVYCGIAILIITPAQIMAYTYYYIVKLGVTIYRLGEKSNHRE